MCSTVARSLALPSFPLFFLNNHSIYIDAKAFLKDLLSIHELACLHASWGFVYHFQTESFSLNSDVLFYDCFLFTISVYRCFIEAGFYSAFAAFYSVDFDPAALFVLYLPQLANSCYTKQMEDQQKEVVGQLVGRFIKSDGPFAESFI